MNVYSIALFLHIAGALGFFVVQGVEWIGLSQLRSATLPEEARAIMGVVKRTNRLGFVSILTTVTTGIYMMLTAWRGVPWIIVVLGALVLEIVIFVVLTGPRMAGIEKTLASEESPLSNTFHTLMNHPILWISIYTRTAILLGIVFLKVARPNLGGSLLAIGVAILLSLAFALFVLHPERVRAGRHSRMVVVLTAAVFVAAVVLLAAKSIIASPIPPKPQPDIQTVQGSRTEVPTNPGSSNYPTQVPVTSPEVTLQQSPPAPTSASEAAPQEGQSVLQARCAQCHSLQKVLEAKKTRAEWEQTLLMMKILGTKISDSEKDALLDYLSSINTP